MFVNLTRAWQTPDWRVLSPSGNPHEVPDDWKLPSTAEVVAPSKKPAEPEAKAEKADKPAAGADKK